MVGEEDAGRRRGDGSASGRRRREEEEARVRAFLPEILEGEAYLYIEGVRRLQMEHGFRPRNRDRMTERMEGF